MLDRSFERHLIRFLSFFLPNAQPLSCEVSILAKHTFRFQPLARLKLGKGHGFAVGPLKQSRIRSDDLHASDGQRLGRRIDRADAPF